MSEPVYQRDASWYSSKGGQASRYHFMGTDLASRCKRARMLMVDHPNDPVTVPSVLRCRAAGCKQLWSVIP